MGEEGKSETAVVEVAACSVIIAPSVFRVGSFQSENISFWTCLKPGRDPCEHNQTLRYHKCNTERSYTPSILLVNPGKCREERALVVVGGGATDHCQRP